MEEESTNPFEGLDAVTSGVINDAPTATASAATIVATTASRSRFSQPSSVTLSRSLGFESTRLLFMGDNFRDGRNDQEVFYDCEDSPLEGRSVQSQSRSVQSGRSARSVQSGASRCNFDDPAAIREALERAANATQMLLTNFDKAGGWNSPCTVTLELTARLVDPKKGRTACPMHGKPVTVQMPLEFNPQSGKIASCQTKKKPPLKKAHKAPKPSICQCQSQRAIQDAAKPPKPTTGKSASEQFVTCESLLDERSRSAVFVGSCGDSSRSYCCHNATCRHHYDPEAREIISICYLPVPEPEPEPEEEVPEPPVKEVEPVKEEPTHVTIEASDTEPEYVTEESSMLSEIEEEVEEKAATPEPEPEQEQEQEPEPEPQPKKESKRYFLALPQNKDFSNCSPCRYDPSPIMDEQGNVFCPGNCGCCMCPWIKRSLASNWEHTNVKVCRCVQRGTIFTKFEDREVCSQSSYFDFCPCREKAEAKYLELYHREMWSRPDGLRGREIRLSEIKELLVPVTHPTE